jgi:hypothetical protein
VARARNNRLARLAAPAARAGSAEALDRCTLRARAAVCALVGDALARAGIDPARATALRLGKASAEAAPHPDPLPANGARENFEEFPASDNDVLAGLFAARIGEIARRYEDERQPDFGNASLAELFAWSLARSARSPARQA